MDDEDPLVARTMSRETKSKVEIGSIERAEAMLPLVRSIVLDIHHLDREIRLRRRDLEAAGGARQSGSGANYDDEVEDSRHEIESDELRLKRYREELTQLGVVLVSPTQASVEFPLKIGGRKVFLCWKVADDKIAFWREEDEVFDRRQPLPIRLFATNEN